MKIVADENIPLITHYFGSSGTLLLKPGRSIVRDDLIDADMLLVRSVTQVNKALLENTSIKFVGSTTTGFDHLDIDYLNEIQIQWAIAAGCNAQAVVEYVVSVVAALQVKNILRRTNLRAGVIGVGRIGQRVVDQLKSLDFEVLVHDPIRAEQDKDFVSVELKDFVDLDLITLHTPLTRTGSYPTYHMIQKDFLQQQKSGCVLINSGRGEVIDFKDLKQYGQHLVWCLDVWEQAPQIDLDVLKQAVIATPHIAGYSVQSKYRGIEMIYQAAVSQHIISNQVSPAEYPRKTISLPSHAIDWRDRVLKIYDPMLTTKVMKEALLSGDKTFDALRKEFVERYEFEFVEF